MWESWVKFYLGVKWGLHPGRQYFSTTVLPQRQQGGQYVCDFGNGGIYAIKHIFFQNVSASLVKFSTSHEKQSSSCRILVLWRNKRNGLIKLAPENIYLKTCPASFPQAQSASFLLSPLSAFQWVLEVSCWSSTRYNPCRSTRQVPVCSWRSSGLFTFKIFAYRVRKWDSEATTDSKWPIASLWKTVWQFLTKLNIPWCNHTLRYWLIWTENVASMIIMKKYRFIV